MAGASAGIGPSGAQGASGWQGGGASGPIGSSGPVGSSGPIGSSGGTGPIGSTGAIAGGTGGVDPNQSQLSSCMPADVAECGECPSLAEGTVVSGDVCLTSQEDVDALQGVVAITGSLMIHGDISLRSLHSLCCLQQVAGSVVMDWMYNLGNVDGFSSLESIGGDLYVMHSNCGNVNLRGLSSLQSIGGDFEVEKDECLLLQSIGVENIGGSIIAHANCPIE